MPREATLPNLRLISVIPRSSGIRPAPRRCRDDLEARWTSGHLAPSGTPLIAYIVPGCSGRQRERQFRRYVELGWKAFASQRVWRTLLNTSRARSAAAGLEGRCCRVQASGGFSAVFVLRHPWRPRCSVARQQPRPCCLSGTDGIDPADCGERIGHCSQVRKSAPTRVRV